jgi:multimeric flavodoxin WrbA
MKIVILNGNPASTDFDLYLEDLKKSLEARQNQVEMIYLRDLGLKYCTGCFDCWTKTPGLCATDGASQEMDRLVINSDFTLWSTPLKMGFPSALLKMALDKHLPLIHPYMVVDQGEAHHLKRYERYPRVGMLIEKESDSTDQDLELIQQLFSRTALNFKTKLEFLETTEVALPDICRKILTPRKGPHLYQKGLQPVPGTRISPPKSITVFNGSPRGKNGNTPIMLRKLMKGFGGEYEIHDLIMTRDIERHVEAFQQAQCVWLGFPLYTDGMPGLVKSFIEALEPVKGRNGNPPIGFLVQSGFPEGLHSRYVERYNARLSELLGAPYLGTIIRGNGEGTRLMPKDIDHPLFDNLRALGRNLAEGENLDPEVLADIAKPERFPAILGPIFRIFLRSKNAHSYFDTMLLENEAFEHRNDRPFVDG